MKKLIVLLLIIIFLILFISFTVINNINYFKKENLNPITENGFTISCYTENNNNYVTIHFSNVNGIKSISYSPDNYTIYPNGKNEVAVDYKVEKNREYIFTVTDVNNIISLSRFITPESHIELIKNDIDVNLDTLKSNIQSKLVDNKIATNFIKIGIGEKGYVNSEEQDMGEIFNNWGYFGDGNWSYNSSTKIISNSFNSAQYTGYYNPQADYNDIDFSFDVMSTDSDDDVIGSMIRFSKSSSNYSSYLYLLDNGGGGTTGTNYNGINKVFNTPLTSANLIKLYINKSLRWTRNVWQTYRFVAEGNTISAYLNNNLIATTQDNSITKGSYGFLSFSQANTYYKNVIVETFKENTLTDIVNKVSWNLDNINIIINMSNTNEPLLTDLNCISSFVNNRIYYVGVTSSTNSSSVNTFISNIGNRGTYIDSSTDYTNSILNYLADILD